MIMLTSKRKFNFPMRAALFAGISVFLLSGLVGTQDLRAQLPEALEDSDFLPVNKKRLELGQTLFFDPIVTNMALATASCCQSVRVVLASDPIER